MGQTMITGAFFVMLIASVISVNRMIGESTSTTYEGDAINLAVDMARSILAEAYRKQFDEKYIDSVYQAASVFTSPSSLGPESGEKFTPWPDQIPYQSPTLFNDVDDYNGYTRVINAAGVQGFTVTVSVYYIDPIKYTKSSVQTFLKRIDVSVEHPVYIKTKITFSSLASL